MKIPNSELIINPDGSIYHLNLKPGELAKDIITVGDQSRVHEVSKHFDSIEVVKEKREFLCHTGYCNGKEISVISTGIGTDNIDIVVNEVDALFNIDFETKTIKEELSSVNFVRLGTSGCLQKEIPLDSLLLSRNAIGIDNLNFFYEIPESHRNKMWEDKVNEIVGQFFHPYALKCSEHLFNKFKGEDFYNGTTISSIGFYGPQDRRLRNQLRNDNFLAALASISNGVEKITNFEMETAGLYLLAANLGHSALSVNVLIANRVIGSFSKNSKVAIENMIQKSLEILTG